MPMSERPDRHAQAMIEIVQLAARLRSPGSHALRAPQSVGYLAWKLLICDSWLLPFVEF
jgi:hypothetical protein